MTARRLLLWSSLLGSAAALSGCVAAAIPLVAGGAMVVRGNSDDKNADETGAAGETNVPAAARVDSPVEAVASSVPAQSLASVEPVGELPSLVGQSLPIEGAESTSPSPTEASGTAFERAFTGQGETGSAAPAGLAPAMKPIVPGAREPLSLRAYDALYSYVDAQARRDPVEQPRDSALLASPALLRPDRTECSIRPPAVVIDIDPGEGTFDPSITPAQNTMLGQMLGAMRLQEIEIYWISALPAVQAGAVRKALGAAGLDPDGKDQLLLMRNGEDRKQERRRELARSHCVVAIAGDTRTDFDELFAYLKDRSAAQPLEELVGAGWFLTPLPLEQGL